MPPPPPPPSGAAAAPRDYRLEHIPIPSSGISAEDLAVLAFEGLGPDQVLNASEIFTRIETIPGAHAMTSPGNEWKVRWGGGGGVCVCVVVCVCVCVCVCVKHR